ncbi:MAG TPA: CPBP family intramembrane glutamic endopeptidase [Anaerolineales bacterium]|nr:CPBP family intramembrane glutamic endopeptidase [Anaerolineales bacterium]
MKNFIQRYQLPSFFLLAYLLSWLSAPFLQGGETTWGLAIAARIVIGVTLGAQGVREYRKHVANWRAGWWYLVAPLIVIGYEGIAFFINLALGANLITPHYASLTPFLLLVLFGGQWEELGWTAYALPKLRERFANCPNGSWIAVLVLGVFRMLWHVPLFLYGKMNWLDIFIFSFSFQIIIAWLYDRSGGKVPVVMLFHFTSNVMVVIMTPLFLGAGQVMFRVLFISVANLFAVILVVFSQLKVQQENAAAI